MKIIIVGCGKVGKIIAEELVKEKHNIVLIDNNPSLVEEVSNSIDVLGVVGDGASLNTLKEAGVEDTDLLLAVTSSDEKNMLCCLFTKKVNKNCKTIARVRNPIYSKEINYIKDELGLTMTINPEMICANEISKLIRLPSALKVDTFSKGRVELISFDVKDNKYLAGKKVKEIISKFKESILLAGIERGDEAIIPHGDTVIEENDKLSICSTPYATSMFLKEIGIYQSTIKSCMIVGGSTIAYYLAVALIKHNIKVTIIDKDPRRCEELADLLPKATIICGYASDDNLLIEEGLTDVDCFVSLTGIDEENVLLSMYAKTISEAKVVTKVNHVSYEGVLNKLDVGALVSPKNITAANIIAFVRSINNDSANDVETMHRILNNKAEALSFVIKEHTNIIGVPFETLDIKDNLLICSIIRNNEIIIPTGKTTMEVGDIILVVTTNQGLTKIEDIVK